ncbi:unnamed protein product, partial [Symbiodinium sp. CCMP2456]
MAVVDGYAYVDTMTVEQLRHYAADAGKSKEEQEKITEPEVKLTYLANGDASKEENTATNASAEGSQDKELEMYEASELASLMRQMYEGNLDLKKQIAEGKVPESFPEEWKKIHTAEATNPEELNETFDALAKQYIANMESIAEAKSTAEAKIAYNAMVGTCASCHQIYCTGPLAKIKK